MATGRLLVLQGMALTWVHMVRTHWMDLRGVCFKTIWREQVDMMKMYTCMKFSKDK